MTDLAVKLIAAALVVAVAAAGLLYVRGLRHDLVAAQERATTAQEANTAAGHAIAAMQLEKARVDAQLAARERFQQDLTKARGAFNEATRKLLQSDKGVASWGDQPVPGPVSDQLRQRTAGGASGGPRGTAGSAAPGVSSAGSP